MLIEYGTPVILLCVLITIAQILPVIKDMRSDIKEIKTGVTWTKECEAKHDEINRRFKKLEE